MLAGKIPAPGARSAVNELEFADYERVFAGRAIRSGVRSDTDDDPGPPLYRRVLGAAWLELPRQVQQMHTPGRHLRANGQATIERGAGVLARLVARVFRFPPAGVDVPVTVVFTVAGGAGNLDEGLRGGSFASTQEPGRGREPHLIVERFGAFSFGLGLVWDGNRLRLVPRTWRIWGMPLPNGLMPFWGKLRDRDRGPVRLRLRHRAAARRPRGPLSRYARTWASRSRRADLMCCAAGLRLSWRAIVKPWKKFERTVERYAR
jgi:hypothetical protein